MSPDHIEGSQPPDSRTRIKLEGIDSILQAEYGDAIT